MNADSVVPVDDAKSQDKWIPPEETRTCDPDKIHAILLAFKRERQFASVPTVLIGSHAIKHELPSFNRRCKDFDLIMDVSSVLDNFFTDQTTMKNCSFELIQTQLPEGGMLDHSSEKSEGNPVSFSLSPPLFLSENEREKEKESKEKREKDEQETNQDVEKEMQLGMPMISHLKLLVRLHTGYLLYDISVVTSDKQSAFAIAKYIEYSIKADRVMFEPFFEALVAPMDVLEAIKTSHIYHFKDFKKHISDLHVIRRYLEKENNPDTLCAKDVRDFVLNRMQPSRSPQRKPIMQRIVHMCRAEINAKKGIPGKKLNLNMSNDDFLEKVSSLFLTADRRTTF